jgi:hypothetical protein
MSIATRIRSIAETYPDKTADELAYDLYEQGIDEDDILWLLNSVLRAETSRQRARVTQRVRDLTDAALQDVKKSGVLRDPRAQRVVDDFLDSQIRVFGRSKRMRDLTFEDCQEAARIRRKQASGLLRSAEEFERAATILQEHKAKTLGSLRPDVLTEAFGH